MSRRFQKLIPGALFAASCLLGSCLAVYAGGLHVGSLPAGRILILGMASTRQSPLPERGWDGDWGLAASAPEKDFAHLLVERIAEKAGGKPEALITGIAFENNYATYDAGASLQPELAFEADIIVLAIGEAVGVLETEEDQDRFRESLEGLLAALKGDGNPAIFVRGCFWTSDNPALYHATNEVMRQAAKNAGAVFVDLGTIGNDHSNCASAEGIHDPSLGSYPGDKGMKAIADAIFLSILHDAPSRK